MQSKRSGKKVPVPSAGARPLLHGCPAGPRCSSFGMVPMAIAWAFAVPCALLCLFVCTCPRRWPFRHPRAYAIVPRRDSPPATRALRAAPDEAGDEVHRDGTLVAAGHPFPITARTFLTSRLALALSLHTAVLRRQATRMRLECQRGRPRTGQPP